MDDIINSVSDFKYWINNNSANLVLDNMPMTGETWLKLAQIRCDYIENPVYNIILGENNSSCDGIADAIHGLPNNLPIENNIPQR